MNQSNLLSFDVSALAIKENETTAPKIQKFKSPKITEDVKKRICPISWKHLGNRLFFLEKEDLQFEFN